MTVTPTLIDGLFVIDLDRFDDTRGSFREAFQQEKLAALGLPALNPVQWNIAENSRRGIVRGIHAEPWDKYIHVLAGEIFAAIVDLRRDSPTFAAVETFTLDRSRALYVAQGLGNAYQVLSDGAFYGYLVNAHWRASEPYLAIAWNDPHLAIRWPLPVSHADLSAKDRALPTLRDVFGDFPKQ